MANLKAPVIIKITHKELQLIYGLTKSGALKRIARIRQALGKNESQILTVMDFCRQEDITVSDFDFMIKRAYEIKD